MHRLDCHFERRVTLHYAHYSVSHGCIGDQKVSNTRDLDTIGKLLGLHIVILQVGKRENVSLIRRSGTGDELNDAFATRSISAIRAVLAHKPRLIRTELFVRAIVVVENDQIGLVLRLANQVVLHEVVHSRHELVVV